MEAFIEKLLFFALGVLLSVAVSGWSFGRTLAAFGVRIEHLEGDIKDIRRMVERRHLSREDTI